MREGALVVHDRRNTNETFRVAKNSREERFKTLLVFQF
jgi:hypothetical protein